MKIYYGIYTCLVDVTDICLEKLTNEDVITIPNGDVTRAMILTDPLFGICKKIFIEDDNGVMTEYEYDCIISINTKTNIINVIKDNDDVTVKLNEIHSKLQIKYGSFDDEYPEQKMAVRYLTGKEKILELGGNIGRNTLVIAYILENDCNLVSLESNATIAQKLIENRDLNNFNFHVENAALSKRKLIQETWNTIPSEILIDGYTSVNTITWNELNDKYNIDFDTLVLDCEGAFYYILIDMPEILQNINLIIMENDYRDISHKKYIDEMLLKNNFTRQYIECGGWWPCFLNFFEVWRKG